MTTSALAPKAVEPIELAAQIDFKLGEATVRPSLSQIGFAGRVVAVQPRIMQVLVMLAGHQDQVVSRNALVDACWEGLSISDGAINRGISQLRRIAHDDLGGAFVVETFPRVGYRLTLPAKAYTVPVEPKPAAASLSTILRRPWPLIAALAALGGAIFVIFLLTGSPSGDGRWHVERTQLVSSTTTIQRHPSISPDGEMLAYSAGEDAISRTIFIQQIDGSVPQPVASVKGDAYGAVWSPHGDQLVYAGFVDGEPCRIFGVGLPKGTPKEIHRCQFSPRTALSWAPDGQTVFFVDDVRPQGDKAIMRLRLSDGTVERATKAESGFWEDEPRVSPDGRFLAYSRGLNGNGSDVMILDLRSGGLTTAAKGNGEDGAVAWAPDSKGLFVTRKEKGAWTIWNMPIDGAAAYPVDSSPFALGRIASGPGGELAAETIVLQAGVGLAPGKDARDPTMLDNVKGEAVAPAFASTGDLAWVKFIAGQASIWLRLRGGAPMKLVDVSGLWDGRLVWSPDGQQIAFAARAGDGAAVRIIDRSGADRATISFAGVDIGTPAWSASGDAVICPVYDGKAWRLWRALVANPTQPSALPYEGWISIKTVGDAIYGLRADRPGVWRVDRQAHQLTDLPALEDDARADNWAILQDEIDYLSDPVAADPQVMATTIAGGASRIVAKAPQFAYSAGFAIDPTSGRIAYVVVTERNYSINVLHLSR